MDAGGPATRPARRHRQRGRSPALAAIDLGTNNCRLLVAVPTKDGSFRVIDSFSRIVRLGEGLGQSGVLSGPAIARAVEALSICAERVRRHAPCRLRAIATAACRRAANAEALVARVREETGIELEIITTEEEARLAATGCAPLLGPRYDGALLFDIGGGSTELIWLAAGRAEPLYATSLPAGVVSLAEALGEAADLASFRTAVMPLFAEAQRQMAAVGAFVPARHHLLGTSGTVTTLAAVALGLSRYERDKIDASWHTSARILEMVDRARRARYRRPRQAWLRGGRARRSGTGRQRDLRRDPRAVAVRGAARRRPGPARRHLARIARPGRGGMTKGTRGSSGRGEGDHVRLEHARGRKASSQRWLTRQLNDPYVRAAKTRGYRSRAAFKLIELDDKFHVLTKGARVLDLGAAPGGWTQVAAERAGPAGRIVGADILEIAPIAGATLLVADLLAAGTAERLQEALGGPADVVLSDMAAATTGHRATDHLRTVALMEAALELAEQVLKPGGAFVGKLFQGGASGELLARLKRDFREVKHVKPPASRAESVELYLVAKGFRRR